jgi:hypothetical protein
MKSPVLLLSLIIGWSTASSQIDFEKGYYIDNNGSRVEGLIKNVDWDNNPENFLFKQAVDTEPRQVNIDQSSEFGIDNVSKYVRATVDLDRSSDKVSELSTVRAPDFKKETIFLKTLVQGKASLYVFVDGDVQKFFYQADDVPLQQLVYKSYLYKDIINQNLTFREQIRSALKCDKPSQNEIERVAYSQSALRKIFLQYNECVNVEVIDFVNKEKRDFFNLWLRPRLMMSSLSASHSTAGGTDDFQFEDQVKFSAGIEAEFILPFNRNKWAIIAEPTYQYYKASISSEPISVDYKAIELPLGLRHYFFLNEHSKLSLAIAFQLNFPGESKVTHHSNVELNISKTTNMAFEAGYVFRNRLCAAFRVQTKRELLGSYKIWDSDFNTMAIVVGYSPF